MLTGMGSNQPLGKVLEAESLIDALEKAETHCRNCNTSSPMVCVERCDVWRVKHEILEIRRIVGESDHVRELFECFEEQKALEGFGCSV